MTLKSIEKDQLHLQLPYFSQRYLKQEKYFPYKVKDVFQYKVKDKTVFWGTEQTQSFGGFLKPNTKAIALKTKENIKVQNKDDENKFCVPSN
jgi:hypothetical protein